MLKAIQRTHCVSSIHLSKTFQGLSWHQLDFLPSSPTTRRCLWPLLPPVCWDGPSVWETVVVIRTRHAQEFGLFVSITQHCPVCSKATISAFCGHVCTCVSYALQQWVKAHSPFVSVHIHLPARPHTDSHKHIIHSGLFMKWLWDDRTTQTLTLIDSTPWISNSNGLTLTTICDYLPTINSIQRTCAFVVSVKLQVTIIISINTALKRQFQYIYKVAAAFENNVIFQWVTEVTFHVQVHLLWQSSGRWFTWPPPQWQSADAFPLRMFVFFIFLIFNQVFYCERDFHPL